MNITDKDERLYFSKIRFYVDVDVSTKAPVPAYCSSDEEDEDADALMYLSVAPEVEEPEDGFIPEQEEAGAVVGKRVAEEKENASPKKKRTKTIDIPLENAPQDETHPLLHKSGAASKDRGAGKKVQGRPSTKEKGKSKGK